MILRIQERHKKPAGHEDASTNIANMLRAEDSAVSTQHLLMVFARQLFTLYQQYKSRHGAFIDQLLQVLVKAGPTKIPWSNG